MSVSDSYLAFVTEQLSRVVPGLRTRRMFGGVGIYAVDLFFGLIDDDVLHLKTDDATRRDYEVRGMKPFQPYGEGGETMAYHQLPEDVLENPDELRVWVDAALGVARRSRSRRVPRGGK